MDDRPKISLSAPPWRPIHYLGSKLRVIDQISTLVDQVDPRGGRVCDLFAGSGTVSAALARQRAVTAVDIQEYSRVLCSALLRPGFMSQSDAELLYSRTVNGSFHEQLRWAAEALIEYERCSLEVARQGHFNAIFDLIELGPIVAHSLGVSATSPSELIDAMNKTDKRLRKLGYASGESTVILRHFGGVYFSYSQAIDLTAMLQSAAEYTGRIRNTIVAAVLSTASDLANTVGKQFAQPIKPRDRAGKPKIHLLQKIIRDRSVNPLPVFSKWLERYLGLLQTNRPHRILRVDFAEALANHCKDVSVIYADPPYTRDHYSRFYHVLETMCVRDDPDIAIFHPSIKGRVGRGVYRLDRYQSPFCIKSQAPRAFARLFEGTSRLNIPLVLSYSPLAATSKPRPRVLNTEDLLAQARRYFRTVRLVPAGRISHSKLNKAELNSETSDDGELFLVCC